MATRRAKSKNAKRSQSFVNRKKIAVARSVQTRTKSAIRNAAISDSSERPVQSLKNQTAHLAVYQDLQKKTDQAWKKLQMDVKRKAPANILMEDGNHLLLLLGECNYMAGECKRICRRWD